jgi:hypothetical protein
MNLYTFSQRFSSFTKKSHPSESAKSTDSKMPRSTPKVFSLGESNETEAISDTNRFNHFSPTIISKTAAGVTTSTNQTTPTIAVQPFDITPF